MINRANCLLGETHIKSLIWRDNDGFLVSKAFQRSVIKIPKANQNFYVVYQA